MFLAIITALLLLLALRRKVPNRLLDGTDVVLQQVIYGTNHTSPPAPFQAFFLRHFREKWYGLIHWRPSQERRNKEPQPIFTFWLKFSSPAAASQSINYAIADENGFEALIVFAGPYGCYDPGGFSTNQVGLVRGPWNFPHRSRKFFLRLYQQAGDGKRVRVAEFPIRNVAFQDYPRWKAEDLPIERQTNGFTFSLVKAQVGIIPPGPVLPPYDGQAGQWSELRFRVKVQGQPANDWIIKEMFISDATGNRLRFSGQDMGAFNGQFGRVERDEIVCFHRWEHWADEPAWKLQVHFEQPGNAGYWVEYLVHPEFLKPTQAVR